MAPGRVSSPDLAIAVCAVPQTKFAWLMQLGTGRIVFHVIHAPRANHKFQLALFIKRMIHRGQQRERFLVF